MKDIVITVRRQKIEVVIYLVCLMLAIGFNIYSIVKYNNTSWMELITQLPYVLLISVGLYVLTLVVRLLVFLVSLPFRRKESTAETP